MSFVLKCSVAVLFVLQTATMAANINTDRRVLNRREGSSSSSSSSTATTTSSPDTTTETNAVPDYNDNNYINQCGVTVTSISNWGVGQCGTRTTSDPRVFGPPSWTVFHMFAQNYPGEPNKEARRACENFITSIPYMLPCAHCGYDFQQFIAANIKNEGTYSPECAASKEYDMPCQGPENACKTNSSLINFFLRAHSNVDSHTKPCKQLWSPAMAEEAYTNKTGFCATGIVWGTDPICKSTDCTVN